MSDGADVDADTDGRLDPAEAFSLLGDARRLEIVTALHRAAGEVAFSELYDRVSADDTGGFNYHLDRLTPHFVSKREDGYALTAAGERVARAVAAGTYTGAARLEPFDTAGECWACGASALRGRYADEQFTVDCGDCGETVISVGVPPSLVRERSPAEFVETFDRWSRSQIEQAADGFCPDCGGAVEPAITEREGALQVGVTAEFDCTVCDRRLVTSPGALALDVPTVETFLRRRGGRPFDRPYWEIEQCVTDEHVTVRSRDPYRVVVAFRADGDACRITFDGELSVVETTVVPSADG
jgi:hypothetical protein